MRKTRTLIFTTICALMCLNGFSQSDKITLEKIWDGTYSAKSVSGIRSMNDGLHYTSSSSRFGNQYIIEYTYAEGTPTDTILQSDDLRNQSGETLRFSSYSFSPKEDQILLAIDEEPIYRRSKKANYYAYDRSAKTLTPVTDFSKGKQQLAAFSPTENKVGFVRHNNLFIADLDSKTEKQITDDGKWGSIINGAVDWVYEEEFTFARGFYWSPEGTKIAYYKFDESKVKEYELLYYESLYPRQYDYKYPKAGQTNSTVGVMVYDLQKDKKVKIDVNEEADQYIPRIKWTTNDDQLAVMRMNRHQNYLEFLLADLSKNDKSTLIPKTIYTEKSKTYIDVNDNLIFLKDGKHFIWNSEKDGWNHIYLYDLDGKEVAQLTKGDWEIVNFYGVDQKNMRLFFSAAIDSPMEQEIYSLDFKSVLKDYTKSNDAIVPDADMQKKLKRLTPNGHTNTADFSKSFATFINKESSADTPSHYTLFNAEGEKIRDLETNSELQSTIDQLDITPKEFGKLKTVDGIELNYWMIKPPDFDASKKYPVMFMIYGGPGSNTVLDSWGGINYFWHQMLAQEGYIIVSVDPRGTMYRGRDFKHLTYLNLGKLETVDMIEAAKYFGGIDYIDKDRIGMMGWSYGGFMTSLAMTKGADYFKMGIAVAPVTNWRYYDSIYTERFMRTPEENASGYDDNSPINFVDQLKGKYLLIHGSADDNVHFQNTMEMITALVAANKQFDLFVYPNKNHSIYGGNTRLHLYTLMTNFIHNNL